MLSKQVSEKQSLHIRSCPLRRCPFVVHKAYIVISAVQDNVPAADKQSRNVSSRVFNGDKGYLVFLESSAVISLKSFSFSSEPTVK